MDGLVRLEFEEQDRQWKVTEIYDDKTERNGEPFPASGAENYTKIRQVLYRLGSDYPGYQVDPTTPDQAPNKTRYVLPVVPKQTA
jgi:hypothetical protein